MKAVVKSKWGDGFVSLQEYPEPTPGPKEAKIRVTKAGICASDLHMLHGTCQLRYKEPVVLGHEFAGVIEELGEGASRFKVGDRVVSETRVKSCGVCRYCRDGEINMCTNGTGLGFSADGAFAKYLVAPESCLHLIPDNVSDKAAALIEPSAGMTHAIFDLITIKAQDTVLVIGPGTLGLIAIQIAKAFGAGKVIISGTNVDEERLKLALELGADIAVNVQKEDLNAVVMANTQGYGADVVIECSGSKPGMNTALQMCRRHGYLLQFGLSGRPVEYDIDLIAYKELHVRGSMAHLAGSWDMALDLASAGKLKLEPLVSDELPLSKWDEGFDRVAKKQCLKIILVPED